MSFLTCIECTYICPCKVMEKPWIEVNFWGVIGDNGIVTLYYTKPPITLS